MSKVAEDGCRQESPPAGSRHARATRDDVDVAVVLAAEAEAEAEVEVEVELDGGPSSVDEIERLEPVWTGSTLDQQCRKEREWELSLCTENTIQITTALRIQHTCYST